MFYTPQYIITDFCFKQLSFKNTDKKSVFTV